MTSVRDVYIKRLKDIFEEHNPAKVGNAARLISKHRNGEHEIYLKVCEKYGVDPEDKYTGDEEEPEAESDDPFASDDDDDGDDPAPEPEADADDDDDDPFGSDNDDDDDEKVSEKDPDDYPEPQAFLLLFRQTAINHGGALWTGKATQLNADDPTAAMYANFKILEDMEKTLKRDDKFTFRLSFLECGKEKKDIHVDFQQGTLPFAEEVEDFEEITSHPDMDGFEGIYQDPDAQELFQTMDGTKFGLIAEQSDKVSERGMMGPGETMCRVAELRVAVPAVARFPLINGANDLEDNCEAKESDEGVTYNNGSIEFDGEDGYLEIANNQIFKGSAMKKSSTIAIWAQWPFTQTLGHVLTKGPWRKAFSIGLRHTSGEGNTVRLSMTGGQGQKHITKVIKGWDQFPKLDDKELQKMLKEQADYETWNHFAMTLGESTFTAYVNGEVVGTHKFYGNAMVKNNHIRIGAGGTGDRAEDAFKGRVFDLMIFDCCLSQAAIKEMYSQGQARAADITKRAKDAKAASEEAAAKKRAKPTAQYMKMMQRMQKRKR